MGTQEKTKMAPAASKATSSRGRRRLDFKRFLGKAMFLDLPGYRHVQRLEEELVARGATVETQFHSGVKYLITLAPNRDSQNHSHSPSTPSPNTPGTAKSSVSQLMSPLTTDHSPSEPGKPRPLQNPAYHTRAQQMLRMSKGRGGRKADLVSLAKQWNCKIVSLDDLLAELKRLKPLPSAEARRKESCEDRTTGKLRKLKVPYLKVEDISHCYRPLLLEMKTWPTIHYHTSPKASPFDPPHNIKPAAEPIPHADVHVHAGQGGLRERKGEVVREKKSEVVREREAERRPGHCECCGVRFDDLQQHLQGTRHQEYARNEENFKSLDSLIAQGKSFLQFITEVRGNTHTQQRSVYATPPPAPPTFSSPQRPDSVAFVTMPTSNATPLRRSPRNHQTTSPSPCKITLSQTYTLPILSPLKLTSPTPQTTILTSPTLRLHRASASPAHFRTTPSPSRTSTKRPRPDTPSPGPAHKRPRPETTPTPPSQLGEVVRRSPRLMVKNSPNCSNTADIARCSNGRCTTPTGTPHTCNGTPQMVCNGTPHTCNGSPRMMMTALASNS